MNQPEFYTAIGFDEPVDVNELSEENRKFFFEQFSPKPVKQNDPAVNAEANVGSTTSTASISGNGSSELQDAKKIYTESLYSEEKLTIDAIEKYNKLQENVSNLTTRTEEGEQVAEDIMESVNSSTINPNASRAAEEFFEPIQQALAKISGDIYTIGSKAVDYISDPTNIPASTPLAVINKAFDYEPNEKSDIFDGKKIIKDSKGIKDFNLINENQKEVAIKALKDQGNTDITNEQWMKYIEVNSKDEEFKNSVKDIFIKDYVKRGQKEKLIEDNWKDSSWDGFSEGSTQDTREAAGKLLLSNLDDQAKSNIATSISLDAKIIDVQNELNSLRSLRPTSKKERELFITSFTDLSKERKALIDAYGDVVNRQIKIGAESEDIRGYIDTVGRNQGWLVNPIGALAGGTYDFIDGVDEFIDRMTYTPWEMAGDLIKANTDKGNWLNKAVMGMEGLEKTNMGLDTAINNMREGLAEPISVDDIDSWSDMWKWSSHLVGSQAANTAVMLTTGGWALPLLGASSAGASFNQMQEEIDLYGAEYTPLQMYTVALGTGLAEALSEKITLGQLNRIKDGLKASRNLSLKVGTRDYIKNLFTKQGGKRVGAQGFIYGKETFEEGFTEAVAGFSQRALERYVLGKDTDLFDGMKDEFISGAFMSGFVYKSPGLAVKMYRAFQPADSNEAIGKLQTRMAEIGKILEDSPSMDGKIREKLENELQEGATKVQQIMARDFKNMDKMTQQEQNDLMSKEDQIYKLRELYDATLNDNNINEKDRKSILNTLNSEYKSIRNDKIKLLAEVNVREEIALTQKLGKETGRTDFGDSAVGTGLAVEVVEDDAGLEALTGNTQTGVEGVELDNGQIILNKGEMLAAAIRNGGNIGTGIHEILHKVLKSEFSKDPVKAKKLKDQFLKTLKSEDKSLHAVVMARAKANYSVEYLVSNPDEYLTILASVLKENEVEYSQATDGVFKKIGNFLSGIFSEKLDVDPSDFSFKDGQDAYNFVQNYVKNTSEGKISDRAKKLAEAGKDMNTGNKMSLSSKDSATVNKIYELQGEAGLMDVVDLMKDTADGLARGFRNRPKYESFKEILADEILSGKRGIMEVAMGYPAYVKEQKAKGEKLAPLSGYLNNSFSTKAGFKRYIEIADRILGKDEQSKFTEQIKEEATSIIDSEVSTEKEIKAKPKPKLRKDLKLQDDVIDKIKNAVVKTFGTKLPNVKSPQFRKELEKQFRTELKSVMAKLMGRTDSYESFLRDNFEVIYEAIPQEVINKRFKDFSDPVMKNGKQVREKTAQGNAIFKKKKIVKAEFIKYFLGSNVGRSTQGTRKTALAETLAQELALDATMEVIQNPGVLEKAIAISQLVDGDFTLEGVSLKIKRPKGVKFAINKINSLNNAIVEELTLANAFQKGNFNPAKEAEKAFNKSIVDYNKLIIGLDVEPFDMGTGKGRKGFLDYAYSSGLITKLPKVFFRMMTGTTEDAVTKGQNIGSRSKSQSDTGYQILINESNDEGDIVSVGYDIETADGSTLRDFAGKLPFRNVTEVDAWIKQIEDGTYEIDGKTMPAKKFADVNSISPNIIAALSSTKYTKMKKNKELSFDRIKEKDFQAEQDKSIEGLKEIFLIFQQAIKDDKNAVAWVGALLSSTSSNQGHFIRIAAPIRFFTDNLDLIGGELKLVEEHSLPASATAKYLFGLAINGTVNDHFDNIKDNYFQGVLNKIDDEKLKGSMLNGGKYNYISVMPMGWMINDRTWARYFNINVGNNNGGIDPASIIWHDGKSIKAKFNVNSYGFIAKGNTIKTEKEAKKINSKLSRNIPENGSISQQLQAISNIDKTMRSARNINTPEKGISVFDFDDTLAKTNSKVVVTMPESVQSITNTGDAKKVINTVYKSVINSVANNSNINTISFSSEFNEQSRVKLYNSLANKLSKDLGWELDVFETVDSTGNTDVVTSEDFTLTKGKEAKKIKGDKNAIKFKKDVADNLKSSFDINGKTYDVSLDFRGEGDYNLEFSLRGKSKGKTYKINATEFAEQSADLEAQGAEFNFDEFSKVIDGKKGPLADLALRRQGKFGSKDIFVLTARPQLAARAIKKFLDGIGLSLPLANITGLENGTPQAKADWVLSKTAAGYNNFYFADDAIKNVKAVKEILDQVDVKSKVQQAKFSKNQRLNDQFNQIVEDSTGLESYKSFSNARAKTIGRSKSSGWFIPPQAEDFVGLLYPLLGKGKAGDRAMQFFKENLLDPFNKAENALTQAKISVANDFKVLKKQFKSIPKTLKKEAMDGFTYGDALRVYIWSQQGMEVPGLSKRDLIELNSFIENDSDLRNFAQGLQMIQKNRIYPKPDESWLAGTITTDIIGGINDVVRSEYLQDWQQNIDIIFSVENLNKLEAAYGANYREALENIISRMKTGSNRQKSSSRVINEITDWLNNSVGAIMFFNTRSAVLQTISAINFVNYGDNNILKAGLAFANQPQFWKDFNRLFNSEYLVARRNGLKINVNESEIADAVRDSKNKPKAAIAYLLKKGFLPTQIADSFAIASGGATFYRNRINTYLKQGLTQQEAEEKAFEDFYAISEETQQSSRTDRISQEQASIAGRVILAFANTPQQYARRSKKDFLDLVNGRGGPGAWKGQIGRIIYYQGAQNLLFNALQNALFAMLFDDDEDEPQDKSLRIANGMADSTLRGMGIYGAAGATLKNILMKLYIESEKKNPKYEDAALEMLSFSPPLDSKVTKFRSALRTFNWDAKEIREKGFSLDNPALMAGGQVLSAFTNIPLDRVIRKYNNLDKAFEQETETWESVALTLGWSEWEIMGPDKKKTTTTIKKSTGSKKRKKRKQ